MQCSNVRSLSRGFKRVRNRPKRSLERLFNIEDLEVGMLHDRYKCIFEIVVDSAINLKLRAIKKRVV